MKTGTILIERVEAFAYHGCYEGERALGQRFSLDMEIDADLETPAASDDLADAIDYSVVTMLALDTFRGTRFKLIEAAAGAVLDAVMARFPTIGRMRVTVRKLSPPIAAPMQSIGVVLERARAP